MNNRLRNGLFVAFVGLMLVFAGAVVFYVYITRPFQTTETSVEAPAPSETILVLTRDLSVGTIIQEGDFKEAKVPLELLPRDYITDPAMVINRILITSLVSGEFLLEHQLANPTDSNHDISYFLAENKVLMAFSPSDLMMNLGIVQKGDIVDILVTMPVQSSTSRQDLSAQADAQATQSETRTFTFKAMEKVTIEALVLDGTGRATDQGAETASNSGTAPVTAGKIRALLVALSSQDALLLKHFKDVGAVFDIVIRSPSAESLYETKPIMAEYLRDRYGLEIPRQP